MVSSGKFSSSNSCPGFIFSVLEGRTYASKMAPTNTRQSKTTGKDKNHDLSDSDNSEGGNKEEERPSDPAALSATQMETVSLLVKTAVAAAVAQVLPLAQQNAQNTSGFASPGTSAQGGASGNSRANSPLESDKKEEGEVTHDEELDEYEKSLIALLGDSQLTGPEISDKIGRLLQRSLGNALDEKVIKMMRDEYLGPENVNNLQVPRTNPIIFKKASTEHQFLDRGLQATQSYLVGGITAVGRQVEKLLGLRTWASNLEQEERDHLPEVVSQLTGIYVHLMDSLILLVRVMSDLTNIRRKMLKNDLADPYKALMDDDKIPPTAEWLGGDDVHGAIRKAKANAGLAEDIGKRNKWPKKSYNKNSRNYNRPYDKAGGKRRQYNPRREEYGESTRGGGRSNSRGRGDYKNHGDRRPQQDFWRRDSQ